MARKLSFRQAINEALTQEMTRDPRVILMGEDISGGGFRAAAQHSQCLYNVFTHIPGLKCVVPSSPYEAKGLLIQSIRDDDPVMFFEHKMLYDVEEDVPEGAYTIPFGEANVLRD